MPSAQCFFAVSPRFSIVDTLNPSITAPADIVQECTSPAGTPVILGAATANDQCDSTPTITNNAPPLFPLGMTAVQWTATDDSGHQGSDSQTRDDSGHDSTGDFQRDRNAEQPVAAESQDGSGQPWQYPSRTCVMRRPSCHIKSVASNEPINGTGDGNTDPDWVITGPLTLQLRAERAGNRTGRIYTITVECTDGSGNSSTKAVTVVVAHDQS